MTKKFVVSILGLPPFHLEENMRVAICIWLLSRLYTAMLEVAAEEMQNINFP